MPQVRARTEIAHAGTSARPHSGLRGSAAQAPSLSLPGDFSFAKGKGEMGQGGLEPPTPRLSSVCSNQLSYWPSPQPGRERGPTRTQHEPKRSATCARPSWRREGQPDGYVSAVWPEPPPHRPIRGNRISVKVHFRTMPALGIFQDAPAEGPKPLTPASILERR